MMNDKSSIKLVTHTKDPLETIGVLWYGTKSKDHNKQNFSIDELKKKLETDEEFKSDFIRNVNLAIESDMPLARHVSFTFDCTDTPVAWREHVVRHHVGHEFWAQSSRMTDLSDFDYYMPPTISQDEDMKKRYEELMNKIQEEYKNFLDNGIKYEDAKMIMPESRLQKIYWWNNLSSLRMVFSKRSCWIAQSSLWTPILVQIADELRNKVHPIVADQMGQPPCYGKNSCPFKIESENRLYGNDPLPICPIHFQMEKAKGKVEGSYWENSDYTPEDDFLNKMKDAYIKLWPSGERKLLENLWSDQ